MTSKYSKWNVSATTYRIFIILKTQAYGNKPTFKISQNKDNIIWKMTSKYEKLNISADWINGSF